MSNALNSAIDSPQAHSLEQRIEQTRREVKKVDIIATIVTLLAGAVIFLFAVVLLDHWIFSAGLANWMRVGLFAVGISALIAYLLFRIIPIIRYSVNPVYAAQILETHKPSLKNALINWILIRRERQEHPTREENMLQEKMFEGVTKKAALGIAEVPREMTVDHSQVFRWAMVLVVTLIVFCLYTVISPKSPLQSIYRLMFPLANIEPPQSVRFIEITPGNETVFQGDHLTVGARIANVGSEKVFLYYSSDDGRLLDEAVPMSIPEGGFQYECRFPPQKTGFEESLSYRIGVGKSRSPLYRIEVRPPITFEVRSVTYHYPEYTGLGKQIVYNTGDLRAIEGTKAEIEAKSNIEIHRAMLIPDNDDSRSRSMTVSSSDKTVAVGSLMLHRDPLRPNFPEFTTYSPKSYDSDLNYNKLPSIYRVEVIKDRPPVIDWVNPEMDRARIPVNGSLEVKAKAEDPDYGIRFVKLHIKVRNRIVPEIRLFDGPEYGKVQHMTAVLEGNIQPGKLGLEVGDEGEYWVEVLDSKIPNPNTAETMPLTFIVTDFEIGADQPKDDQPNNQQQKNNDDKQNQDENKNPEQNPDQLHNELPNEQNGNGEDNASERGPQGGENSRDGNQGEGENDPEGAEKDSSQGNGQDQPQKRDEPMDGENDPGGVIQEALEQLKKDNPEKMEELEKQAREEVAKQQQQQQQQNKQDHGGAENQPGGNAQGGGEGDSGGKNDQQGAPGSPQAGQEGENQPGAGNSGQSNSEGNEQNGGGESGEAGNANGQEQPGDPSGQENPNQGNQNQTQGNQTPGNQAQGNQNGGDQNQPDQNDGNQGDNQGRNPEQNPGGQNPTGENPQDNPGANGNQNQQGNPQQPQPQDGNSGRNDGQNQNPLENPNGQGNQNPNRNNSTENGNQPDKLPETSGTADPDAEQNARKATEGDHDPSLPQDDPGRMPTRHDPSDGGRDSAPGGPDKDPIEETQGRGGNQSSPQQGGENTRDVNEGGRSGEQNGDQPGGSQQPQPGQNDQNGRNPSPEQSGGPGEGGGDTEMQGGNPQGGNQGNSEQRGNPGDMPQNGKPGDPNSQPGADGRGMANNPEGGSGVPTVDTKGDEVDRKFSELATQFVLEELEKGNQAVYDRLGWSKDEANQFLNKWKNLAIEGEDVAPGTREFGDREEFFEAIGNLRPGQRSGVLRPGRGTKLETATESRHGPIPAPIRAHAEAYSSGISED